MHPRLTELTGILARNRAVLLDAVAAVPDADRDRRPDADRWSVAEHLEHLRIVESGTAALLAKRAMRAREAGVGADPDTASVAQRLSQRYFADVPGKTSAPDVVRPTGAVTSDDALRSLQTSRAALLDTVAQLDGVDATQVLARHAVLGEMDAYQWLLFIAEHELRHARQIGRVGAALAG